MPLLEKRMISYSIHTKEFSPAEIPPTSREAASKKFFEKISAAMTTDGGNTAGDYSFLIIPHTMSSLSSTVGYGSWWIKDFWILNSNKISFSIHWSYLMDLRLVLKEFQ